MRSLKWIIIAILLVIVGSIMCINCTEMFGNKSKKGDQCTEDMTYTNDKGEEVTIKCVDGYYKCGPCKDGVNSNCCPGTLTCGLDGICH